MSQRDPSLLEKEKISLNANVPASAAVMPPAVTARTSSAGASKPDLSPAHLLSGANADKPAASSLIARLGRWFDKDRGPGPDDIQKLFTARLTDVAANKLAKQWCEMYVAADPKAKRALLSTLAEASNRLEPRDDKGLRGFKRLYAQADSLKPLVELRADMLRWRKQIAGLSILERELEGLLANWFDVGMLELKPITWDSPASLLEKLIQYEAVHEIGSWDELRHRVAGDRRCYAFFHPRMNGVPLIFVEVAFAANMADNVQVLLDHRAPQDTLDKSRWAIFYSISNTQAGLKGISFGNFLLKRVIDALLAELPRLKSFATLSPIPGFAGWLSGMDGAGIRAILGDKLAALGPPDNVSSGSLWVQRLIAEAKAGKAGEELRRAGLKLVLHYLLRIKDGQPVDPVARFHLGNGARIERLNWAADMSAKGLEQSCGIMVNYLYELEKLDDNLVHLNEGKPRVSRSLRWL